ncbi:MAG: hypothetical protein JWM73_1380 [Solirubrobacterales bacterium]|nr:hypothetical protein [Solirubrobacterales bacterium]
MRVATLVALLALAVPAAAAAKPRTVQQRLVARALLEASRHVHETPAHSNTSPAIRRYHTAVKHARPTEAWCTIFVSYVAARAGYPLGSVGQGIWDVQNLFKWGKEEGFYFPKGTRKVRLGDIAVHGYGHAGIVVKITKRGAIYTVDGNWSDSVVYHPLPYLSLTGYVRLPSTPRAG